MPFKKNGSRVTRRVASILLRTLVVAVVLLVTFGTAHRLFGTFHVYVQPGSIGLRNANQYYSLPFSWVSYGASLLLAVSACGLYAWQSVRRRTATSGLGQPASSSHFRYSVRLMLVAVTLLALMLGWCGTRFQAVQTNTLLSEKLRSMGAIATLEDGSLALNGLGSWLHLRPITKVANVSSDDAMLQLERLKHLKLLQITGSVTDTGLACIRDMASLTELYVSSPAVSDAGLESLAGLQNLEVVSLTGTPIGNTGLRHLSNLKNLRVLEVGGCPITDAGLLHLRGLERLEQLRFSSTGVSNAGLAHLAALKHLNRPEVSNTNVTSGGLANLLVNLQKRTFDEWFPVGRYRASVELSLIGQHHHDDIIEYLLVEVPDLTRVYLVSTQVTNHGIAALSRLAQLKNISLADMPQISLIEGFPTLVSLSLAELGDADLPQLRRLPELEELSLATYGKPQKTYRGHGFAAIGQLAREAPKLKTLNLDESAVGDAAMPYLAALTQLRELNLGNTLLTDVGLASLAGLRQLESLQLWGTEVTNAGLTHLQDMKNLRRLGLHKNRGITDEGLKLIAAHSSLENVSLFGTGVSPAGKRALEAQLPDCRISY